MDWLRALGIRWVVVNYPDSTDAYKDYAFPEKFDDSLQRRYFERGTGIFEVPQAKNSMARLVDRLKIAALKPIRNVLDVDNLASYLSAVEAQPAGSVDYRQLSPEKMQIDTNSESDSALLVRTTYDPGWHAEVDGKPVQIEVDPLSFMRIALPAPGAHQVTLEHRRTTDVYAGYAITALALLWLPWQAARRGRSPTPAVSEDDGRQGPVGRASAGKAIS